MSVPESTRVCSKLLTRFMRGNYHLGSLGITEGLASRLVVQEHAEEATTGRRPAAAAFVIGRAQLP